MKTHVFSESIIVGNKGEEIVKRFLCGLKNVASITDVSSNAAYQKQDIDLIINFSDGTSSTAEIKTDTYTSGNIFFETVSNLEANVPGCMYKTKADFLLYYFTKTKELYILDMPAYLKWFKANRSNFTEKKLKNINRRNNGTYTSVGYTIPKVYLEKHFNKYQKIVL